MASYSYSETQRIVLVIDLQPVLASSSSYTRSILAAAKRILNYPPLAKTLFSFKLFFSSLTPLRSSSLLDNPPSSLSFDLPNQTLLILSQTLHKLSSNLLNCPHSVSSPRVTHTRNALLQLLHDYSWETDLRFINTDCFPSIPTNLVLLFSPIIRSLSHLSDFMDLDLCSSSLDNSLLFINKFTSLFTFLNDAFLSRDIHLTWVHVGFGDKDPDNLCEVELFGFFEKAIRSFNWGCCLSDAIVFGSALVPFHLIYPNIGVPLNIIYSFEKSSGQLSLEISDVNGIPLECKCCDLELLNLRSSGNIRSEGPLEVLVSRGFGNGMKLRVTSVFSYYDEGNDNESCPSECFLVREFSGESEKRRSKSSEEFIADKVLQVLSNEAGENGWGNGMPIWQILLSFLQNKGYWATISITNGKGDTSFATLKPFTVHWALLSIMSHGFVQDRDCDGAHQSRKSTINSIDCHNLGVIGSQTDTSTSRNKEPPDGKRRKSKKPQNRDLTWSSLCDAAFECSHFDLAEVYFSSKLNKSKKLKFLKCWMKQIGKCSHDNFSASQAFKSQQEKLEYHNFPEQLQMVEEALCVSSSKNSESFFSNLPCRIQHGIRSKMSLQMLAERLVKASIYWLCQTTETDENVVERKPGMGLSCKDMVYKELRRLLLKDPKEMKDLRRHTSDDPKHNPETKNIVREYELQIFLRMEILRSDISESIKESTKHKLLKQICSHLEILQYLVEGGIHGHIKLFDYVERNIKSRYFHVLEDSVNEIYTQMDLLPFGDDDEAQVQLLNSEDSNQSCRDRQDRYEKPERSKNHQSVSADDDSSQAPCIDENSKETGEEEHARKLSEARERRERSRRFVYLTSKGADLHRIWAPKQQKMARGNLETVHEKSKQSRKRVTDSVVCETPPCGTKRPFSQGSIIEEEGNKVKGNSCSVSKALFQDDI
ncbi:hypothetical protein Leryth_024359 [Lithospermum erythrorhizon]|nr:hypothetical protein Leryth_024359 [Lithospermum erythrorhizon]